MADTTTQPQGSPACDGSARWVRTVIKLEKFGRKWVTISCFGWSSHRKAKIGVHELPKTVRHMPESYIIARATIEERHLQVSTFEPDTQKTGAEIDADWREITQNDLRQARAAQGVDDTRD